MKEKTSINVLQTTLLLWIFGTGAFVSIQQCDANEEAPPHTASYPRHPTSTSILGKAKQTAASCTVLQKTPLNSFTQQAFLSVDCHLEDTMIDYNLYSIFSPRI